MKYVIVGTALYLYINNKLKEVSSIYEMIIRYGSMDNFYQYCQNNNIIVECKLDEFFYMRYE